MLTSIVLIALAGVLLFFATKLGFSLVAQKAGEIVYGSTIARKIGAGNMNNHLVPIGATVGYQSRRHGLRTGRAVKMSCSGRVLIDLGGHTVRRKAHLLKVLPV